jgi:hypothetical protein
MVGTLMIKIHEDDIKIIVDIVTIDCQHGHSPSLYKRDDKWRYHLDRFGNNWYDGVSPAGAMILVKGRDYNLSYEVMKLRDSQK